MNGREAFRLFMLIVLMVIIQYTVGLDLRIAGAHPDLMLLMPIAAGVVGGPEIGAATGFAAGIATDLLLPTPFGLSALVYSLVGFSVGYVMDAGGSRREGFWWLTPLIALAASAVAVMLYAVLGAVLGQDEMVKVDLAAVVTVVAVINAVLSPVACRMVGWALDSPVGNRRRSRRRLMARRLDSVR